ncbi:DAK2 domain-containing protein, partial [Vibrio cholerae O1]|nr:DAK2 domain-containing protein [Vibrio cholerae O1]
EWKDILKIENLNISEFLNACSLVIMEHCGGASVPIWGSAFRAASKNVINKDELTVKDFAEMMQEAVLGIQ